MDTSPEYITMCEKAEEIQDDWVVHCGDYCLMKHPKDRRVVIVTEGNLELRTTNQYGFGVIFPESYGDNRDYKFKDTVIWLPRQDQLQDILRYKYDTENMLVTFYAWCRGYYIEGNYVVDYKSMEFFKTFEQLWLAFVMKEKYNKVWNGNNWEEHNDRG